VASQIGGLCRNANKVTHGFGYFLVATRADVTFECFIWLYATHFDFAV